MTLSIAWFKRWWRWKTMMERSFFRGWRADVEGRPFSFRQKCKEVQDPSFHFEWREWPLRSTLIKDEKEDKWLVVELCQNYRTLATGEGFIAECEKPSNVLTVLHRRQEGVQAFGEVIGELVVNSNEITLESSPRLLRAAAEFLGLSKGGSKMRLWRNINAKVQQQEALELFEAANNSCTWSRTSPQDFRLCQCLEFPVLKKFAYTSLLAYPLEVGVNTAWAAKAEWTIKCFWKIQSSWTTAMQRQRMENHCMLTVLVGIDKWSKMVLALPIPTKANSVRYQAEQVVRWSIIMS